MTPQLVDMQNPNIFLLAVSCQSLDTSLTFTTDQSWKKSHAEP